MNHELYKLISDLIKFPTINPSEEKESYYELVGYLSDYLKLSGFSPKIIEFEKGWPVLMVDNGQSSRREIMLNGHYDVVPTGEKSKWIEDPFSGKLTENGIFGRGATDMKGGLGVQVKVFTEIADKVNYKLSFVAVPDEETGGFFGSKYLAKNYKPSLVLISEPSGSKYINIGEKGLLQVKLIARGKVAHGSLPSLGDNAIMRLVKDLLSLERIKEVEVKIPDEIRDALLALANDITKNDFQKISFNPGIIKGGIKINVVPDYAEAEVDMRIPPGISTSDALQIIKSLVSFSEVEPIDLSEPNYTSPNNEYVKLLKSTIEKELGVTPKEYIITGATDGRYFRYEGVPVIVYGPGELGSAHSYNEFVSYEEVDNVYKVLYRFLLDLTMLIS
ncbi:MAG: M20 family metallopeptidase [Sulfolobaceae archaeon]|jgi:succinyl-diaminopimelate desuccinylase|nr:M20 family metallopeptidase [Sulfolobaceae archaeon]